MSHLLIDSEMLLSMLDSVLPTEPEALVVVRRVGDDGVRLYVLTVQRLRYYATMHRNRETVGGVLPLMWWADTPSTPSQETFDPLEVGLQPGDSLGGVFWSQAPMKVLHYTGPLFKSGSAYGRRPRSMQHVLLASLRPTVMPQPCPTSAAPPPVEEPAPTTGAEAPVDEPFEAYPGIRAPETARVGQPFKVDVWLSREPVAGVLGLDGEAKVIVDLEAGQDSFDLDLQVVARGFRAESPGWRQPLHVSRSRPEQTVAHFTLVPEPQAELAREASIQVHFTYKGNPCGYFWREVLVLSTEAAIPPDLPRRETAAALMEPPAVKKEEPATTLRLPAAEEQAADLTVRISKADGNHATGLLTWTFESPWPLRLPAVPPETDLGDDCQEFAKAIVELVQQCPEGQSVVNLLRGAGRTLADKIPAEFWSLMDEVWAHVKGRAPSVLLLTEEAYVPWELVWVDPPWDASRPGFLGAQVNLARWILSGARSGPAQPPRTRAEVKAVTVLAGDYASDSGYRPLPEALAEAAFLAKELKATTLKATEPDLNLVLSGRHAANLLHFACHGEADPGHPEYNRIVLGDQRYLSPLMVRGSEIRQNKPFVFLNACQVGQGGETLGEYAGFASAFLKEQCPGFLGPLWSVDDVIAREVAEQFYRQVFRTDLPEQPTVGEILRDLRSRFTEQEEGGGRPAATYLAYVFYGHPNLRLVAQKGV